MVFTRDLPKDESSTTEARNESSTTEVPSTTVVTSTVEPSTTEAEERNATQVAGSLSSSYITCVLRRPPTTKATIKVRAVKQEMSFRIAYVVHRVQDTHSKSVVTLVRRHI